jgi:hypothetical protein
MPASSPSVAAWLQSFARADRSWVPERFRGGCPFGAPRWMSGVSPGRRYVDPGYLTYTSSQRNTRSDMRVAAAARPSRMPMAGSPAAGPSPRAITSCMPVTR